MTNLLALRLFSPFLMAGLLMPPEVAMTQNTVAESAGMQYGGNNDRIPALNRLPHEILSDTFLLLHGNPCLKGSISSVCRRWRIVINQTPQIWSKLVVFPRRELCVSAAVERLNMLIDRSGMILLDVEWGCLTRPKAALSFALATCLLERTPVSRWRSLRLGTTGCIPIHKIDGMFENLRNLTLDHSEEAEEFLEVVASTAPKLAFLKLPTAGVTESKEGSFMKELIGPETLLQTAVIYRGLSITHIIQRLHVSFALDICLLPLLRELTLDHLTSFDSHISTLCPNLETLTVRKCVESCSSIELTMPHLRALKFHGPNYSILGRVDAPKLQTLHVAKHGSNQADQMQSLHNALDNPTYQLFPSTLYIDCLCDMATIIQLLQLSPALEHLTVTIHSRREQWQSMLVALGRRRQAPSEGAELLGWQLCEHLATLHISFSWTQSNVEEDQKLAKELLISRPMMQKVFLDWIDGYSIAVDGC
jgi:F-box-like